ncbi:MAG: S-layer protein [Candidatus Diapherotrites archaeon]|nr:S-layer protein [Candidatus Diapherotrites archaeon]
MKGLNIKKLAAIAAGGALLATAVAPIVSALDLTKTDVFNDAGSPIVKVVVGSSSAPSDGVWAGNIAAAIANKARTYKTVDVGGAPGEGAGEATVTDLSAKLIVGGSVTFSNSTKLTLGESANTTDMNSETTSGNKEVAGLELTDSSFSEGLQNKTTTIKWAGSTYNRTFKEKIGLKADVAFDSANNGNVADLEVVINTGDLNYVVDLGQGVPVYESTTSGTFFTDGTNDNVLIPFFGETYLVREVNKTSNFVRLIKSEETKAFLQGDLVPDLKGKNSLAGQTASVRIDSIIATGPAASSYSADVTLIDEEGNERITKTVATGENINEILTVDGLEAIDTVLYVDSIGVDAQTGAGTVKVLVGTNLVDLYSSNRYPYDSTQTSNHPYIVSLNYSSDGNYITVIGIKNENTKWTNGSGTYVKPPLYPPEAQALTSAGQIGAKEAVFLGELNEGQLGKGFFSVEFQGLETNEPLHTIRFYNHTLEYVDASDRKHTIPLRLPVTGGFSKDSTGGSSFTFDGRTIYYMADKTNRTFDMNTDIAFNGARVFRTIDGNGGPTQNGLNNMNVAPNTVHIVFGNGADLNVPINGEVDINGFYFTVTDTNGSGDINKVTLQADGNVIFSMAQINSSGTADYLESWTDFNATRNYLYMSDANTSDYVAYNGNTVSLKGQDDVVYQYALFSDNSTDSGEFYLLFDSHQTLNGRYDADIKLWGTDINEDGNYTGDGIDQNAHRFSADLGSRPYYWPNIADTTGGPTANAYYTAAFGIETAGDGTTAAEATADFDTNVYIDTAESAGYAPALPNTQLSQPTSDLNYNANGQDGSAKFVMDTDPATTTAHPKAYNDYGVLYEISDTREVKIVVPDNRRRPVLVIKMEGSTTEVTGGEELTLVEGEAGTTSTGTSITLEEVLYSASCGGGGDAGTCQATPENYFEPASIPSQLVYLDTEAPTGTLVLVGGHLVNRLTAQITGIEDQLTAPGDGTSAWRAESGEFVVAGYTPADTVSAARDFISSIEAIDMMG